MPFHVYLMSGWVPAARMRAGQNVYLLQRLCPVPHSFSPLLNHRIRDLVVHPVGGPSPTQTILATIWKGTSSMGHVTIYMFLL